VIKVANWNLGIVIPCRNEEENIPKLIETINSQSSRIVVSIVFIENASTDETCKVISALESNIPISMESICTLGGLSSAAEFTAFLHGAKKILRENLSITHVMKLDADVRLSHKYFETLQNRTIGSGLVGSPNPGEHKNVISGATRIYSRDAFKVVAQMPQAVGFDVLDEIYISNSGYLVECVNLPLFTLVRKTGSSEGILRGRYRSGIICKVVGYSFPYFLIRIARYAFRKPLLLGSIFMFCGYASTKNRAYPNWATENYSKLQWARLRESLASGQFLKITRWESNS
jgi:glycosyltransferase involved in cell wall biosynthesis